MVKTMTVIIPPCKTIFCHHAWEKVKNTFQSKYETIKDSFDDCCSSDFKIYMLVIAGRLLQAAAIAATMASVAFTFVVGPIALVGLVPPIAAFLLGHFIVQRYKAQRDYYPVIPILDTFFPRTFVPGQPVGLRNGGMNCWISSFMQCVVHIPQLRERARLIPELKEHIDNYLQTQDAARETSALYLPALNDHLLNLVRRIGFPDDIMGRQSDPSVLFGWLFGEHPDHGINTRLYDINSRRTLQNGNVVEAASPQDLVRLEPKPDVEEPVSVMFDRFLNHTSDRNEPIQLKFNTLPETLACHLKRYTSIPDPVRPNRIRPVLINREIEGVDAEITLPEAARPNNEKATYACEAFIIHMGGFSGGHYIAYVKKEGIWWRCDDSRITPVSEREATIRMKRCYIFFANRQGQ